MRSNSWSFCKPMDNAEREAQLDYLQARADGPTQVLDIYEHSLSKALVCALSGLLLVCLGVWLATLPMLFGPHTPQPVKWLLWGFGVGMLMAGLAGLALAEALRRRHGQRVLGVTPDTLCFANSPAPVPWHSFDAFEIDQRHLSTVLVFSVSAFSHAPSLGPACFKSLVAPHAVAIAGGLRIRLWLCTPTVAGKRVDAEQLVELLYPYLEAAQARRTLAQLFPGVARLGERT